MTVIKKLYNKGFSLAEMLVVFLILGVVSTAALPLLTQVSQIKTGVDKNTMQCIVANSVTNPDSSVWYDDSDGTTSVPAGGTVCYAAVLDTRYNRGRALNTAAWYADYGTAEQKVMAKRILRAACDESGAEACDYFINTCWKSGSATAPYCDDTSSFLDLTYYLHHDPDTTTNRGVGYIVEKLEGQLPKMMANLVNEVTYACSNNQAPDVNQNLNNNISCDLSGPWMYIKGCNLGNEDACTEAHDNNWNKSCSQIKAVWPTAPTDNYKLTFRGAADLVTVSCNTLTAASAAITGCNGMTGNFDYNCDSDSEADDDCSEDCLIGYHQSYNRSCALLVASWPALKTGTYNLTLYGAPPEEPVPSICFELDENCMDEIGLVCLDNTVYAGNMNGKNMFIAPVDIENGGQTTFPYNDGSSDYTGIFAGSATPTSDTDGRYNSYIIKKMDEIGSGTYLTAIIQGTPHAAVLQCENLNNTTIYSPSGYLGHDDWYLPADDEIEWLCSHQSDFAITAPFNGNYWSSTNVGGDFSRAYPRRFYDCNHNTSTKNTYYRVRCMRNDASFTPPGISLQARPAGDCSTPGSQSIGTRCTDAGHLDQIYAGYYGYTGKYYYTTENDFTGAPYYTDTFSWNNDTENWTVTGATSHSNGSSNTTILTTEPVASDAGAPYYAAKVCADLNENGKSDWYLPAVDELNFFCQNVAYIGNFYSSTYWTSTEATYDDPYRCDFSVGSCYPYLHKNNNYHVRCIRSE